MLKRLILISLLLVTIASSLLLDNAVFNHNRLAAVAQNTSSQSDRPTVDIVTQQRNNPGHATGDATAGKLVFRFETFGNERFWTEAMRLPQGMLKNKTTILQALKDGLMLDVENLDQETRETLTKELKTDLSPRNAPMLNDPKAIWKVVNANAFAGLVAVDTNRDGKKAVEAGDKMGISCAICHTITDKSVFEYPNGGSVGRRVDGPGNFRLNMGALLASAANSRAFYPNLQAELGGKTIGRAPQGLTKNSTEAEVDAYLKNPEYYPRGTFDDTSDGVGNSVVNVAFFRTDLAAPWGTSAANNILDHIANGSYTVNLDQTTIATPEGRQYLKENNPATGEELWKNYVAILKTTGVKGYPYVKARLNGKEGENASPTGRQVDEKKLFDMNAYTNSLPAPKGAEVDRAAANRGRELFQQSCTTCHNVDQSKSLPLIVFDLKTVWPGYQPTIIAERKPPKTPVQNAPGIYDDKFVVEDASERSEKRGVALPLLLDLARKPIFLHDASVHSLDELLDPKRGANAPHPFYLSNLDQRADMVQFLRGLDTDD